MFHPSQFDDLPFLSKNITCSGGLRFLQACYPTNPLITAKIVNVFLFVVASRAGSEAAS